MRALVFAVAASLSFAGCGSAATNGPPAPTDTPQPTISVQSSGTSGVSRQITLSAGTWTIDWSELADKADCDFDLFLTKKANGPTVVDFGAAILPTADEYPGSDTFSVAAGSYVIQADHSGLLNCRGPWDATLTKQ